MAGNIPPVTGVQNICWGIYNIMYGKLTWVPTSHPKEKGNVCTHKLSYTQ